MHHTETHCPAIKAAQIVGDAWVLQIIRAMLLGARRYSDLQAAIPRISPAVLSGRLKSLAENGLIAKRETAGSRSATYRLTPSGRELQPLVEQLGVWGMRWAERNVKEAEVDIGALMWDVHRTLRTRELPDGETVLSITLADMVDFPKWWLVARPGSVDLCTDNPGKEVDVYLSCTLADLIAIWRGEVSVREAIASEALMADGAPDLLRTIDNWMPLSPIAGMGGAAS